MAPRSIGRAMVATVLLSVATACSSSSPGVDAPPNPPEETSVGMPCNYTDPAVTPIPVERAMRCPDGTQVWVRGVVMTAADGAHWLCDADARTPEECVRTGLQLIGGIGELVSGTQFFGVKSGHGLQLH